MSKSTLAHSAARPSLKRSAISLTFLFLLIEFFDELHYGIQTTVLPSMRAELGLDYAQVGLLLGLPGMLNTFIEPVLMLLGDTPLRKRLMLGGGLVIAAAALISASASSFTAVLLAFIIAFPAGGAFVTLAQATLMDRNPGREPQMMARWTAAGSLANVLAPLLVTVGFALAWGWRWSYLSIAALGLGLVFATARARFPAQHSHSKSSPEETHQALRQLLPNLWKAVRTPGVIRWLLLLDFSDLLLDVLYSYTALYFADVAGLAPAQVGVLLTILTSASLVADLVLIPVLERLPGRSLVRFAAGLAIPLYAAFLLAPWPVAKIVLLVLVRFSTMGWYPVLQGELYASLPGRSGTAMAISSASGVLAGALVWFVGWAAELTSLPAAMWLLMLGPLCLVALVPHHQPASQAFQKEEPL